MDAGQEYDFQKTFFEQYAQMSMQIPKIALMAFNNENSPYTTGTGYCKNCHLINSSENCEDCYYGKLLQSCSDAVDCSYAYDSQLVYQCFNIKGCYDCIHLSHSQNCNNCYFSEDLKSCKDCFLCTNLSQKQYCFMNKQLSKEKIF